MSNLLKDFVEKLAMWLLVAKLILLQALFTHLFLPGTLFTLLMIAAFFGCSSEEKNYL
jgi:uncharacterized membrane protein YdjX (TVP38/TMEM64 family)